LILIRNHIELLKRYNAFLKLIFPEELFCLKEV